MLNCDDDLLKNLEVAEMKTQQSEDRVRAIRDEMMSRAQAPRSPRRPARTIGVAVLLMCVTCGAVLAGTAKGRSLISQMLLPARESKSFTMESPDGVDVTFTALNELPAGEEGERISEIVSDMEQIKKAGGGHLVGLLESFNEDGSIRRTLQVEYFPSFGVGGPMGETVESLSQKQRDNMRIGELLKLHDAGEGELVKTRPFQRGGGSFYYIRYTFADGGHQVVQTWLPPGSRADREAIFAETRALKKMQLFSVSNPYLSPSEEPGREGEMVLEADFTYKLSSGEEVTIFEKVPAELISADGKHVLMPGAEE